MRFAGTLLAALSGWLLCSCATPPPDRPLVLVHVMPWFESKAVSGRWGWHWTMDQTDPGQGKLASHDQPSLGAYDSSDPALIATQVALMKAAGIDGAIHHHRVHADQCIAPYACAMNHRPVTDVTIDFNHGVAAGKTMDHASVLQVRALFHDQPAEVAAQTGAGTDVAARADDDVADQHRCRDGSVECVGVEF